MSNKITSNCSNCENHQKSLFCDLSSQQLKELDQSKFHQSFQPGQYLFYSGNPGTGIFCILSGTVKLENQSAEGKPQIVQVFSAGDLIGYRALFSNQPFMSSAIAVESVESCFIPKTAILQMVQKSPELAIRFLTKLSQDYRQMESRLLRITSSSAIERVAEALLFLKENFSSKNWTRKEIAEWAGTTSETVIRTLADFEREDLIEQRGRTIFIRNRVGLLSKAKLDISSTTGHLPIM